MARKEDCHFAKNDKQLNHPKIRGSEFGAIKNLNQAGLISHLLDTEFLNEIAAKYLRITGHSFNISEINGDYVIATSISSWCKLLDTASRKLCKTDNNQEALNSGKWHCHESCWKHASLTAIQSGKPIDTECNGGLRLYALPIRYKNKIIGAVNFGYSAPSKDKETLSEIANKYGISVTQLEEALLDYSPRPVYSNEMAKEMLIETVQHIEEHICRKQTEIGLIEIKQQFETLFSNIPIGIFTTTSKGKPIHINPALANMLGASSSEEAVAYYQDLSKQLYKNPMRRIEFLQLLKKNGEILNFKYEAKRMDGKTIWLTMNAKKDSYLNKDEFNINGFVLDISQQVISDKKLFELNNELIDQNIEYFKLNEELQESIQKIQQINIDLELAKNKAEESDRLKSYFLANMSHEIRTPMNSIMGFASLLPVEQSKQNIAKYTNIIVNSSEQLVRIIDAIVLYSKLQTKMISPKVVNFEVFKLLQLIQQSFDLPIYNHNVRLIVDNPTKSELYANSDYDIIRQIISNLVSNSFKYTLAGEIHISSSSDNNTLSFYVKDTGIGIPKDECKLIFDRFYRGSNTYTSKKGGTGLGLSIVSELVQLLNGKINVNSTLGEGTTFEIVIPQKKQ